ncbi:hypothetical protein OSB04_016142 [Centaurea solstitialis]|uniref:Protein EXECUTER 1, chloroplastic n=1 Tax=Centaurea solstitialis TaxID=347529 RepID=A0AA38W867_9ASTR|nr:hypothetical protein OSB04_016142 [Centaurea solstitialis]
MASISPPTTFPSSDHTKLTYATPKFHHRSSTRFPRVLDSPTTTLCRCQKSNNDETPRRGFQESVRNVIKWFDDNIMDGYRKTHLESINDDSGGDGINKESEVVMEDCDAEDWDWERWKKHFTEVDEQERIVSILKSQLNRAVVKEDYEDAARIKVSIAAASTNDTVGRVMARLNKAIKDERYKDATFVRDYASAGLVGWWAGFSDDSKDPYGCIIRISAEHGRYLARSYSPRQLAKAADGAPLFEVFITMNGKGEYRHQAVYLKRSEVPTDFPIASSKLSDLISSFNPLDSIGDKGDLFAKDSEDTEDVTDEDDNSDMAEEYGFENIMRDMIPGGKDVKIKVMNVTSPGKLDRDLIAKVVEQIMDEEDEDGEDGEEDNDTESESMDEEVTDETAVVQFDIDFDAVDTITGGEGNSEIAVKVMVGGLVQEVSNDTSHKDLIRVPAKLEKNSHSSFTFSIEKEKQQVSSDNAQSPRESDASFVGNRRIDSVMLDLAKSIGRGKIPMKVLKDVNQLINLTLSQAQNRQPLSGSTTFNRIHLPSSKDPLSGLYVGAHGIYTSEVIHLKRKFGQWQEDGSMKEFSNLEFYEYVEAVKITGDPYVPAGQVAFRAKVGTKYQLPHRGIIPEEFGIARYRGQGRLADPGFKNPRWVDGELVVLDGKYINGGPVVGFVYWAPESQFLVFFNQLKLQG